MKKYGFLFVPREATLKVRISIENIVVRILYINHQLIPNFVLLFHDKVSLHK